MFKKATTRLTIIYLGIIMAISLAFSISLYQISIRELDRGVSHQRAVINRGIRPGNMMFGFDPSLIFIDSDLELQHSKERVLNNLLIINITILITGGVLSYLLARRSLKPIEQAHQAQSRFAADASHELRTPIAAMQTETEVALMNPKLDIKEARIQLKSNLEELAKLTSISEGLLRLARFENKQIEKIETSLTEVIKSAIKRVEDLAKNKKIDFVLKLPKKLNIMGDSYSLEEAIVPILDNAIKYSPVGSKVNIQLVSDNNTAIINVKDHGIGIRPKDLPHIFDRFYRANTARCKTEDCGYGLGLSISKNIIELHGGNIEIKSVLTKGSTFIIKLPI